MFFQWFSFGHMRVRMYKRILFAVFWVMLALVAFEYYYYSWFHRLQHLNRRVVVVVETRRGNGPAHKIQEKLTATNTHMGKISSQPASHIADPAVIRSVKGPKPAEVRKETMPHATIHSSEDEQAEIDSRKRKESVDKVCRKLNVTKVLEPPENRRDRKKLLQRFNVLHHVIVNEKHRVLYCFIPKVGCSNMKRIFLVMQGLYPSVEKVNIAEMNVEIVRLDNKKFTEEQRVYMLKNFYKFMLVRDPMERLASAYRNKWQDKRNVGLHASLGKQIIEKYRYNNSRKADHGDDVSFTEYARYLVGTPSWELNEHWIPYEDICQPCNVKYDFIGSVDTIARDVPHLMRKINANETKYHLIRMRGGAPPLTKTKGAVQNLLRELPKKYFDQLIASYKTDHELFGYPIPNYETLHKQ